MIQTLIKEILQMFEQYNSIDFEKMYTYTEDDLGATWSQEKTMFRLWAPTADSVQVCLYKSGNADTPDSLETLSMSRDVSGTWTVEKNGDLNGIYYTYLVNRDGERVEVCDPYARTTGVNGHRAMVIDLNSTNPEGWEKDTDPNYGKSITDAVIYELHVRDLSMNENSGIHNKGKFLGLAEIGTKNPEGLSTGLDYIKNLGVTHIHLLPVYDFGFTDETLVLPQYNWGYDPVNFNVPEGSFATDPYHGAVRVREMKQMIKTLHDNGLSVVMDVVYNHVYDGKEFCFNQIVPGYFSRVNTEGVWSNGSICGNDTASERNMVHKYIVDSVCYWADEYHIDGFRFDLVGLIDIKTINAITTEVHKKHPNVIFYGEGWDMPTELTKTDCELTIQPNSPKVPEFSFFNDTIRDLLRGDIQKDTAPGYIAGAPVSKEVLNACFMGMPAWAANPYQCINYVSCHDNHTLFDRIALTAQNASAEERIRMNRLAAAFSILSQGVPFFHAGEEMLRTKPDGKGGFDENSYRSPDEVNAFRWENLSKPEYQKTIEYYRGLIEFRKTHTSLRHKYRKDVLNCVETIPFRNSQVVIYRISGDEKEIFLIFNASKDTVSIDLPSGNWDLNIHDDIAGTKALSTENETLSVTPISASVLTRTK